EIINRLIYDLLENSDSEDKGFISYSRDVERALISLREYSRKNIYNNAKLITEREKIERMYATLFMKCLDDLDNNARHAKIFTDFINTGWISKRYVDTATNAELARD